MSRHRKTADKQGLHERARGDGSSAWRAYIRKPGGGKIYGPTRDTAAKARADFPSLYRRRDSGQYKMPADPTTPTVGEAFDSWLRLAEAGKVTPKGKARYAPRTLRDYSADFDQHLRPLIGGIPVTELRRSWLQENVIDELHNDLAGQRVRNVLSPLSKVYKWLLPRNDTLVDPTHGLDLPAKSKRRMTIATPAELQAMLAPLAPREAAVFALAGMAGLRNGEIWAMRASDIDLKGGWIVVSHGWDAALGRKDPKSRAGDRQVPIFAPLVPYLEAIIADAHEYALLPSPMKPRQPMDVNQALKRIKTQWADANVQGLPDLHSARHSFASHLIYVGYDPVTAAEWCGHEHPSMTLDWYAKSMRGKGVTPDEVLAYLDPRPDVAPRRQLVAA